MVEPWMALNWLSPLTPSILLMTLILLMSTVKVRSLSLTSPGPEVSIIIYTSLRIVV